MRRLLRWLRIVDLVWTRDYDGEVRLRIVWYDQEGLRYVYGICGPTVAHDPFRLEPDGTVRSTYVKHW